MPLQVKAFDLLKTASRQVSVGSLGQLCTLDSSEFDIKFLNHLDNIIPSLLFANVFASCIGFASNISVTFSNCVFEALLAIISKCWDGEEK